MDFYKKYLYNFKTLLVKYLRLLFAHYFKSQAFILNLIVSNTLLYFIYILMIVYSSFGCLGEIFCTKSHIMVFFVVSHLQMSSIELFFICKFPITKNWLIKSFSKDYFLANFSRSSQLILKFCLPLLFLFFLENVTTTLIGDLNLSYHQNCIDNYKVMYGADGVLWSPEIKNQFLKELENILNSTSNQGVVCFIGHRMTYFFNSLVEILKSFV